MKLAKAYKRLRVILYYILCYIILYYIMLCCVVLCCIVLCDVMLCYIILYIHSTSPTCFGHTCGQPQGDALQRITTNSFFK